jgi:hypothetical protein
MGKWRSIWAKGLDRDLLLSGKKINQNNNKNPNVGSLLRIDKYNNNNNNGLERSEYEKKVGPEALA